MALEGNLTDLSLPNILQMMCLERRTLGLELKRGAERGVIHFEHGDIVHAETKGLAGEEAVYHLLAWREGDFKTCDAVKLNYRSIAARWDQMLMEGMRRLDEFERDHAAGLVETAHELTADELEHDAHLENEMLLLMLRLDNLRARLAERHTQKKPAQVINILSVMAAQVATLSNAMTGASQGRNIRPGVEAAYLNARDDEQRRQIFNDISTGIVAAIDHNFANLTACFRSPVALAELKEACDCFLADLNCVVTEVKA